MNISIGIVGLPNVGKSTLFNALLKRQIADAQNYPFCTIEPNVGIVEMPDRRLQVLYDMVKAKETKIIPAVVKFVDIAGLVKGAASGEGLGNQFLSHIRECQMILEVVRDFSDENVIRAGAENPESDMATIKTELILKDLETVQKIGGHKHNGKPTKEELAQISASEKLVAGFNAGLAASEVGLTEEEESEAKNWQLLTMKPIVCVLNTDETRVGVDQCVDPQPDRNEGGHMGPPLHLLISAKMESELSALSEPEQKEYLSQLGLSESGLDRVIKVCYHTLGLQTFLTAGPKEVRAWTIQQGAKAPEAAGTIHGDFERGFISAEVCHYDDYVAVGGWQKAKELGKVRLEGREYVMKEGDIVEFRFSV